jgi:hypothetical protein
MKASSDEGEIFGFSYQENKYGIKSSVFCLFSSSFVSQ